MRSVCKRVETLQTDKKKLNAKPAICQLTFVYYIFKVPSSLRLFQLPYLCFLVGHPQDSDR